MHPFGATSLYDAIAETARRVADRPTTHRAVVVLSDGIDTRSRLTGPDVSAIATAIDVPVYLVAVVSPLDHPDAPTATGDAAEGAGRLKDLARWTGGGVYFASSPREGSRAMTELLERASSPICAGLRGIASIWVAPHRSVGSTTGASRPEAPIRRHHRNLRALLCRFGSM